LSLVWRRDQHSAAKTDHFLFHQLIPYLGNKRKLLPLLHQAIRTTDVSGGTFVDFFAGSGVVSRLAKTLGFQVLANDWEPYAREINLAYVGCNAPPEFRGLGLPVSEVFERLNRLDPVDGYVARHLCPRNDRDFDPSRERMFFTRSNGERIDAVRQQLATWERECRISDAERAFVLASLLYSASYVSNTSGVFKGFHRGWGGATSTALYRILSRLQLTPPVTYDNGRPNRVTALDAQRLAEALPGDWPIIDLAYLDPPYNQHPYGSNYHVLNTIALGDQPPIRPTIGAGDKSAIRTDWRTERRSAYNNRRDALHALVRLLETISARFILVSYSADGLIPVESLVQAACCRGAATVVTDRYKRYRVSTQRYSRRGYTVEFVLIVDAQARTRADRVGPILDAIREAGTDDNYDSADGGAR
jgi:adenine-specific DNA-methyltransferase